MADEDCSKHGLHTENEVHEAKYGVGKADLKSILKLLGKWYVIAACLWLGYTLIDLASMHWGIPGWHTVLYLITNAMLGIISLLPGGVIITVLEKVNTPNVVIKSIATVFGIVAIVVFLVGSGMDLYYESLTEHFQVATIIDGPRVQR